ncbi:carbohydrate ABC transporter substrate-binding protein, CUT1 family (TC 3.A.1.1.-) [Gracilibacillus orientalis]|uniref:Carbohydrate ABC transporter substrate-binding protein, CUT1 family (TC 3.A.1.1.-) n=1 Tax=Gracilibacillus orientalis TaxID=334253 RepID=A0A1I4N055_9BACI|nr:extracellular solute-binding protein [Gracilibacillus orientalis]SFM08735.1 carbohydrate ABC transporter substrate-binding protein, CUT1 family (TC 3.A.1.1.-) [Gracilibacillus orientalis]
MQNNLKALTVLFFLLLFFALIVGCSDNGTSSEETEQETELKDPSEVGYPESLTYWAELNGNAAQTAQTLNDVRAYQVMEETTGTTIEFKHPSGEGTDITEQFNLMLASGKLPDMIEYNWRTVPKGPDNAIEDGTIIRLNEIIEDYAPNLNQYLNENPEVKKTVTTDEGNIYTFPFIRGDEKLMVFMGMIIRQDWLDTLDLDTPTTIAEWEEVLKAFKTGDPNGNGEQDEVPLLVQPDDFKNIGPFVGAYGIHAQFYNDNGTVKYGSIQPEFKEFLTTMNRWYEEGLLDADFAAMDGKLVDAKVTNDQLGSLFGYTGGGIGRFTGLMEDHPTFELSATPHPALEEGGIAATAQKAFPHEGYHSVAISGQAENPEEIAKWLDFAYSEEGHMLFNFGVEGESYEMIDGYPTYTEEITNNPDGLPMSNALGKYIRANYGGPMIQDVRYVEQYLDLPAQKEAIEIWEETAENNINMPPITMNSDESDEFNSIMSDLDTYYDETVIRFIMGDEPLDNFDEFVATLEGMGINRAIELQQAALDRYMAR